MKDKSHMIISIDVEKIQHPFLIKTQQSRNREDITQHNKGIYDKPTAYIIFNSEKLKVFYLCSGAQE